MRILLRFAQKNKQPRLRAVLLCRSVYIAVRISGRIALPLTFAVNTVRATKNIAVTAMIAVFRAVAGFVPCLRPQISMVTTIPDRMGTDSVRLTVMFLHAVNVSGEATKSATISGIKNMITLDTSTVKNDVSISGKARIDIRFIIIHPT